jgi:hypothetical protein
MILSRLFRQPASQGEKMQRPSPIQLATFSVLVALTATVHAQTAVLKDDLVIGRSAAPAVPAGTTTPTPTAFATAAGNTLQHWRDTDLTDNLAGTNLGTSWNQIGIQRVAFDNLNGFRHNANGNLLGVDFGAAVNGSTDPVAFTTTSTTNTTFFRPGTIYSFGTRAASAANPQATSTPLFVGSAANTGDVDTRLGGLSVSPANNRVAFTAFDSGKLVVMDYTAGNPSTAAGAALNNLRSVTIPGIRVGAGSAAGRTSGTAWLDNNRVLVVGNSSDGSTTGDLKIVTVGAGNSLTVDDAVPAGTNVFGGFNMTFTSVAYEPTISPYVFVAGSLFAGGNSNNKVAVLDPSNNFALVGSVLDLTPSTSAPFTPEAEVATLRDIALDSKGNVLVGTFAGGSTTATPATAAVTNPIVKSFPGAANTPANITAANSKVVATRGTVASSFSGFDVAITNVDYKTPGVRVDIASGDITQQYFGTTSPASELRSKLALGLGTGTWDGTAGITSSFAATRPGNGIGYTVDTTAGTFRLRYTRLGDADLTGICDFNDLLVLAQNYNNNSGTAVWSQGDFTYDGSVNFSDLLVLAQNYNASTTNSTFAIDWAKAQAMVPEPTALTALAGAGLVLARRRRAR